MNKNFWNNCQGMIGATVISTAIGMLSTLPVVAQTSPIDVDLELFLLVDVSGSVDNNEFNLQRTGYVNAFNNSAVISALTGGPLGRAAVSFAYWSGATQQSQILGGTNGWFLIENAIDGANFATAIDSFARPFSGLTAIGSAINFAVPLFGTETGGVENGFTSTRQVIDISGDGTNNAGVAVTTARDNALAAGVDTINGLAITTDVPTLLTYFQNNVIGGTNAFAVQANDFASFGQAIQDKIIKESSGGQQVPEPTGLMAFLGLAVVGAGSKFKAQKSEK